MKVRETFIHDLLDELGTTKLVAATKYIGSEEIDALDKVGVKYFGENRVQALVDKYEKYQGDGEFHMIGTLQRNKVKYIIDKVTYIHSLDNIKLIKEVEKQAKKHNLVINALLQVNIAKEESKHGFDVEELDEAFSFLKSCPHICVKGFMMMAPNADSSEIEIYFKQTQDLLNTMKQKYPEFPLTELSMGMSNDYQIALKYGATMVRIGSALFE